ncbi:MAG: transglutaminase domain-containing protein [Lachnospiraceae bacterium]|nr:transglutaminase domain-containing protein [Lachnospiraceae bacterium]
MFGRSKNKNSEKWSVFLAKGIVILPDAKYQEENRRYTLLLKGLLVYLIVMGIVGCFLSSLGAEYSAPVLNIAILLSALFCASLYYSKRWERIGYIILFAFIVWFGNIFSTYINSGFYALINIISERAAVFFDTSAMRSYGEQVGNRYAAVTISMCFIGCVSCVFSNIMLSRNMRYKAPWSDCLTVMLIPMYLELEPDGIYVAMFMAGLISAYVIKYGGHYHLTQNNNTYEFRTKDRTISYVYSARAIAGIMAVVCVLCTVVVGISSFFYPKEQHNTGRVMSSLKKSTMDTVENISVLGVMGLFNFNPNTGGIRNGELGGVNSVRFDFETDLTVEFTPYNDERVYLKTFVGATYLPYSNMWSRITDSNGEIIIEDDETAAGLKKMYEEGAEYSAKGIMKVTNVAAAIGAYLPYYSEDIDKVIYPMRTQEYTYYPRLGEASESVESELDDSENLESDMELWLIVPDENIDVIADFVEQAELTAGNTEDVVNALAAYYQDNIPYTLRPGMTPYRRDFINYFLAENKRGYCAHFASAATLIFRYLGIPARYVEGYAIDPSDIASRGELLSDENYEDYYDGYSPLMTTAVVSVDATDANAHAWVEVYDDKYGWIVAEVTPYSYEDEEGESLWQRLMDFLTGGQVSELEDEEADSEQNTAILDEQTRKLYARVLSAVAVLFIVILICRPIVKKVKAVSDYRNADKNGKLIILYQNYIRKKASKNKELTKMVNYEEQIAWLIYKGFWKADENEAAEYVRILEKAGFSQDEVSEEEFNRVVKFIR